MNPTNLVLSEHIYDYFDLKINEFSVNLANF